MLLEFLFQKQHFTLIPLDDDNDNQESRRLAQPAGFCCLSDLRQSQAIPANFKIAIYKIPIKRGKRRDNTKSIGRYESFTGTLLIAACI